MYTQVYHRRTKTPASAMAPRRGAKANIEAAAQGSDNVSDTSPRTGGSVSTWSSITDILQSEAVNCSDSDDYNYDIVKDDLNTKYKTVVQSGMHLVAARPRLLPYFDMIRWALDHIDLPSRTIVNDRRDIIGTFRPEHIQAMYKLPATSEFILGKEFFAEFKEKECNEFDKTMPGLIKDWVSRSSSFRVNNEGVYSISSLEPNYRYVAMMTCRFSDRRTRLIFTSSGYPSFFGWQKVAHSIGQKYSLIIYSTKSPSTKRRRQPGSRPDSTCPRISWMLYAP
jgi:hypothetical protein